MSSHHYLAFIQEFSQENQFVEKLSSQLQQMFSELFNIISSVGRGHKYRYEYGKCIHLFLLLSFPLLLLIFLLQFLLHLYCFFLFRSFAPFPALFFNLYEFEKGYKSPLSFISLYCLCLWIEFLLFENFYYKYMLLVGVVLLYTI